MKNKLPILAILLISLFKPNLTYSMEKSDEQQKNQSSLISEFTNALNNAFQEITCKDSEYIDYEQIALTIIDIFINGNQDQKTFLEAMNKTIAIDKFKDKFKEIGNTAAILLINKIIKNIPLNIISKIELLDDLSLDNYSQESKEEIFEQKRELIRNILITALDLTLSQEVKPQNKKNILKSIINYKLHQQTITVPEDLKDMMLGFSAIFTLWILGHIFCHDLMEYMEPQQFISVIFYISIVSITSYIIITKVLKISENDKGLIQKILPNIIEFVNTKLDIRKHFTNYIISKLNNS